MRKDIDNQDLTNLIDNNVSSSLGWKEPESFDLSDAVDKKVLQTRFDQNKISTVIDGVRYIADELFEITHPDSKDDKTLKEDFVNEVSNQQLKYGKWFLFPWAGGQLVRYPNLNEHRLLRTARNRELITSEEQLKLYEASIAVMGLSVGSNIVDKLVTTGIGGKLILADMDEISPTNLNRISGDFTDVGSKKVDYLARKISKIDPYIEQVHYREGVDADALEEIAELHKPEIIFDEVDQLAIKALIRSVALKNKIAVMMATDVGDKSLFDVERYDLDQQPKPFLGRLSNSQIKRMSENPIDKELAQKTLLKLVGIKHVNTRLIRSGMQQGVTLSGIPQLGVTASMGGSLAAIASREMLLGRKLESGRYEYSPKKALKLKSPDSLGEKFKVLRSFIKYNS